MRTAFIGMGANLPSWAGPPEATLIAAALRLESLGLLTHRSSLYSTEPVGFSAQPRFVNAVVTLETGLEPRELLDGLLALELDFGRDRSAAIRNGPRTLDLDLLLMDGIQLNESGLEVPHPRLSVRPFVLIPLYEIAQQIFAAGSSVSVSQLIQHLPSGSESKSHDVVPIECDGWRVGACRGGPGSGGT
jgi:2-amino-4-hydroxy-6-hydroxymethyldihydropteridine diphosphokinase